jgi:sulfate adenylyltransferase
MEKTLGCFGSKDKNRHNLKDTKNNNDYNDLITFNKVLNKRQLCDLELLLNGAFSPLNGFLCQKDYECVLDYMRLNDGSLWTMPIVLPFSEKEKSEIELNYIKVINLCDLENRIVAKMDVEDIYFPDIEKEAEKVFGVCDDNHPYIKIMLQSKGSYYIGGKVEAVNPIIHFDFSDIRLTPSETKKYIKDNHWEKVLAFQTRNPMHRSHFELTKYALNIAGKDTKLMLHPVVGVTQECDVDYFTRVKCYKKLLKYYPENTAFVSLLPLSMRMAGPREAVWHAQIRKNYGATHFVIGRDHAGPSYKKKDGNSFFGPYDAQDLIMQHKGEIGIEIITSKLIVYAEPNDISDHISIYGPIDEIDKEKYTVKTISGTQQRVMLKNGDEIPSWFSFPDVITELKKKYKPLHKRGLCIYFVGLSGSGKSTIAKGLRAKLLESNQERDITIMDGDIVRRNLTKGLGFTKDDRSTNVRRIGFVCSEISKHGGISLAANIAPYAGDRIHNRKLINEKGGIYIEVFVDTDLSDCEERDCKGLYKLARAGVIKQFTGISDPFETPENPEIILKNNNSASVTENVEIVYNYLLDNKYTF